MLARSRDLATVSLASQGALTNGHPFWGQVMPNKPVVPPRPPERPWRALLWALFAARMWAGAHALRRHAEPTAAEAPAR
jgi:hypothetical protein